MSNYINDFDNLSDICKLKILLDLDVNLIEKQ